MADTRIVLIFIVITILSLNFLTLRYSLGVKVHIDLMKNDGWFKLYLFFIPVFKGKIRFEHPDIRHNNLVIEHGSHKDEIHLSADKSDNQSVASMLAQPLLSGLKVRDIKLDARVGKDDDAMFTTMVLGTIKIAFYGVAAFLKSRQNVDISESFTPEYNANVFEIDLSGIISISIADIIYGFILTLFDKNKSGQQDGGKAVDYRTKRASH